MTPIAFILQVWEKLFGSYVHFNLTVPFPLYLNLEIAFKRVSPPSLFLKEPFGIITLGVTYFIHCSILKHDTSPNWFVSKLFG